MDDTEARIQRDRGERARRLLEDDLIRDALRAIRDKAMAEFTAAKPNDVDALRDARLRYDMAQEFVNQLHAHVTNGQLAETWLDEARRAVARVARRR